MCRKKRATPLKLSAPMRKRWIMTILTYPPTVASLAPQTRTGCTTHVPTRRILEKCWKVIKPVKGRGRHMCRKCHQIGTVCKTALCCFHRSSRSKDLCKHLHPPSLTNWFLHPPSILNIANKPLNSSAPRMERHSPVSRCRHRCCDTFSVSPAYGTEIVLVFSGLTYVSESCFFFQFGVVPQYRILWCQAKFTRYICAYRGRIRKQLWCNLHIAIHQPSTTYS